MMRNNKTHHQQQQHQHQQFILWHCWGRCELGSLVASPDPSLTTHKFHDRPLFRFSGVGYFAHTRVVPYKWSANPCKPQESARQNMAKGKGKNRPTKPPKLLKHLEAGAQPKCELLALDPNLPTRLPLKVSRGCLSLIFFDIVWLCQARWKLWRDTMIGLTGEIGLQIGVRNGFLPKEKIWRMPKAARMARAGRAKDQKE